MCPSSMGASGIMRQSEDSYRRSLATAHAKPSDTIIFRAATQQQVLDALREEATNNVSPTVDLAQQGLYNPGDTTLFHPANIGLARYLVDTYTPTDIQPTEAGYRLSRAFHEELLRIIKAQPSSAWLQ